MSEKKFKIINELGDYHLLDGDEELCYDLCSPAMAKENWDNVVEKLNELNTEREYLIGERGKLETKNVLLRKENEQLRKTIKEVIELLLEEVDLFSDKATEHDIIAYKEMNEFDNKDAYYMCVSTKKAIKMLQRCL